MNEARFSPDAVNNDLQVLPEPTLNQLAVLHAYWRLDDVVCREFLKLGTNPADFGAVKLLFPFVRETGVCNVPREWRHLPDLLFFAFFAGHDLSCKHPELINQILPGEEVKIAKQRLQILQKYGQGEKCNGRTLNRALEIVAEQNRPTEPGINANTVVCRLLLKTVRAGAAAGRFAQADRVLSEYWDDLDKPVGGDFPIMERGFIAAPWRTYDDGWTSVRRHPLLRLTRELYPDKSLEGRTVLAFLERQLEVLVVNSEEECPTGELDLLDWVTAGLEYGWRVKAEQPGLVAGILQECAGKRLEDSRKAVQRVVSQAERIKPINLIRPLLKWYEDIYHDDAPGFYGHSLARVGCLADFAVWIPWVIEEKRKPRRKKAATA